MIDPKSLRIGSRIYWKGKNEVVIEASDFAELEHDENYFDAGSPIPLTDEVLIRAGFAKNGNEFTYPDWFIALSFDCEESDWHCYELRDSFWITSIKYLHQLQNLFFSLCGTELEIKP